MNILDSIMSSPFVEGAIGILEFLGIAVASVIAGIIILAVLLIGYGVLESILDWMVTSPLQAAITVLVLLIVLAYISGLWAIPIIQQLLGAATVLVILGGIGYVLLQETRGSTL